MRQKDGDKYSGEIIIPESVEYLGATYSVTSILNAFNNCYGLTSVSIPNSVKTIGFQAFLYCSGLTSVTIPNSVTSIEDYAFWGCSALTSVTIGNSVESIGTQAFYMCSALTSVTIPKSVTRIRDRAFGYCSGFTSIVVESGNSVFDSRNNSNAIIETATNTLLYGCSTTIIPDDVTSIGDDAFSGCSGLTSVTIPNSVTSIGDDAFSGCSGLTSVTIPNSVTSIGDYAFSYCSELLDVYCYAERGPSTGSNVFEASYIEKATLHVPAASLEDYQSTSPWNGFGKIVALTEEETGIDELKSENRKVKTAVYDLSGRRVQKGEKGIFIQNGKVVLVR